MSEMREAAAELLESGLAAPDPLADCADALTTAGGAVRFGIDKAGKPRIAGVARMHAANQYYKEQLAAYDYDGSDEERKKNSRFLAAVRAYKANVKEAARDYRAAMFSDFDSDLATLVGDADDIIDIAERRKRASRKQFEDARLEMLEDFLAGAKALDPALDGVELSDCMDSAWLNRSTSEKQAREALDARLHVFSDLTELKLMPQAGVSERAELLRRAGWETTRAIKVYREQEQARADAEALAAKRAEERARALEERAGRTVVRVSVATTDLARFREALDAAGIDWKEV